MIKGKYKECERRIDLPKEEPIPLGTYRRHLPQGLTVSFHRDTTYGRPVWASGKPHTGEGSKCVVLLEEHKTEREAYEYIFKEKDVRKLEADRLKAQKDENSSYYAD